MDLKELYRDVILDHNRHPRNFGRMDSPNRSAQGHNPLCGDELSLFVRMNGTRVEDIRFEAKGCAISTASASLMTEAVKGKERAAIRDLYEDVHRLLTRHDEIPAASLGKLAALYSEYTRDLGYGAGAECVHRLGEQSVSRSCAAGG